MPIGSSLGITLPTVGVTAGPAWATAINAALTSIITAVETRVTPSGLNVNDDVEFNLNEALEVGALQLENKASTFTGASNIVKIYSYNGDLYFNDGSANAVRITANGNLNASAIAGIGGDYGGSNPAAVTFTDSTSTYTFFDNSSTAIRALLDCGQILLRRSLVVGAYAVKLTSPTLSADVDRTLLGTNPASTSLLMISSAGVESTSLSPSITGLTITDAAVKHGEQTRIVNVLEGKPPTVTNATYTGGYATMTGAGTFIIPLRFMRVGDRLKEVTVRVNAVSTSCNITVYRHSETSGTGTSLGTTASSGLGAQDIVVTGLTDVAGAHFYTCEVTNLDVGDSVISCKMKVDRP